MPKAISALCILFCSAHIFAQAGARSFDAASIKPSKASNDSSSWNSRLGYMVMRNQTLNACIRIAYGLKVDQITGGPKWLDSDRFDIEARAVGPAKDPELLAMLQTLLAERFQLKFHRGTKLVSGYALVVGKKGLKIHPVGASGPQRMNWGKGQVLAERVSMPKFAEALARMLGSPVEDKTGISAEFSFKFDWSPESARPAAEPGTGLPEAPAGRSLFTAIQEELGLTLSRTKAPIEVFMIDSAEKPTEN